ncbi:MAG: hypothetical protein IH987_00715 [Planctomycetes bacterium]|nr:hypothetical protein [Planctomycetota bacterium]
MSGWGVMTWLAVSAVGPLTFLAVISHRLADCAVGLEQFEENQRKSRKQNTGADQKNIDKEPVSGPNPPTPPAGQEGRDAEKVDQPTA